MNIILTPREKEIFHLLVQNYSTVTVVDTRYISPKILGKYIEFNNQDVLFEYSVLLINNSSTVQ